jgi:hypothetical protein
VDCEGIIGKLIAASLLTIVSAVASATALDQFQQLHWTAPAHQFEALTAQPSTCLQTNRGNEHLVRAGQALFNAPNVLGGQAAKAGLSCASCHVNGRDNPHFVIAGVSDRAGSADVTSSFFSPARGNGRFDPVIIPDLAQPGKVSRDPDKNALEPFIRALIVEEFSGHEPTPATLQALAAYVRAIQTCATGDDRWVPFTLEDQLELLRAATQGAVDATFRDEGQSSPLLIGAARHQLGLIAQRYPGSALKRERDSLLSASRELQKLADSNRTPEEFGQAIFDWNVRFEKGVGKRLRKKVESSLYNPQNVAAALEASATAR